MSRFNLDKRLVFPDSPSRPRPDNRILLPHEALARALRERSNRTDRTPYYITGITNELRDYLLNLRSAFILEFGRDYEDEDPQLWLKSHATGKPMLDPAGREFLASLCNRMLTSNHHPAHVHAIARTGRVIFGCGSGMGELGDSASCFDLDECPNCNFRSVPNAWTREWNEATQAYETWKSGFDLPTHIKRGV